MVKLQETQREALVKTLNGLKTNGYNYLKNITAVDYGTHLTVLYIVYDTLEQKQETITVKLPPKNPAIETAISAYKSADWHERELSEMFGIEIIGRKTPKLLLEGCDSVAPLKKSFVWGIAGKKKEIQ